MNIIKIKTKMADDLDDIEDLLEAPYKMLQQTTVEAIINNKEVNSHFLIYQTII